MKVGPRIYEHSDGRFEARYRKGRKPDGSILYGSVYGRTFDEAEKKRAEILRSLAKDAENDSESAAVSNDNKNIRIYYQTSVKASAKYPAPLDESEVEELTGYLLKCRDGIRLALCLALYMGLSNEEISALRYSDIDAVQDKLTVCRSMVDAKRMPGMIVPCETRTIDIPGIIRDFVDLNAVTMRGGEKYILTEKETPVPSLRQARKLCASALSFQGYSKDMKIEILRSTFIRFCLEAGMNFETVSYITGLGASVLKTRYGQYVQPNPSMLAKLGTPEKQRYASAKDEPKQMNLLILGAGSHGHAVYEIADKLGIFQNICFLDDSVEDDNVIGKCTDNLSKYRNEFAAAIIAIGDNAVRKALGEKIIAAGFVIPKIVSPEASIAKDVTIGAGSVVMPQATINAGAKIGNFAIVESNALVGYRAEIQDYAHLSVASVAMKDTVVAESTVVESGEIVRNIILN